MPISERIDDVASRLESEIPLSEEDYQEILEEYELLLGEFKANISTYTEEEKTKVYEQIGKINGIITRQNLDSAMQGIKEFTESLPDMLNGFIEGLYDDEPEKEDGVSL